LLSIFPANNEIYLSINQSSQFYDIITVLKKYSCWYVPESKNWILSKVKYNEIIAELEDLDIITYTNKELVEEYLSPKLTIKKDRISFTDSDLLFPPIKGKPPYENFQIEDLQQTLNRNRFALYLDVGTGKSWIILSAIEILKKRNKLDKILYITSNSGVYDIKEKFLQFTTIPEDRIQIGNKNNRRPFDLDCDVIICNYRSFLLISDEYQKDRDKGKKHTKDYRSTPIPFDIWLKGKTGCCVLDESHNIAIPTSRQTKSIHLIKNFFEYRYLLSGTPADKEEKYYSQLKFLDDALVKNFSYYEWLDHYAHLGNRFSKYAISSFKPDKIRELQKLVKETCSRRLGENVLDLPPNIIKPIYLYMSPLQNEIYQLFIKEKLKAIQNTSGSISVKSFLNIFPKLLLSVDNPEIIDTKNIDSPKLRELLNKFKFKKDHPKIEVVKDILEDHPDSKVIIWTSHPSVGNHMAEILAEQKPYILNGEVLIPKGYTKEEYKNKIVNEFKASKTRNILIAGIQVLNTAVTIVEANVQIYIDTDFNYTNTEQSYARIYRIGQKQKVFTYKLLLKHTLDITRDNIMKDKDYLNDHFLSKDYMDNNNLETMILGGKL
jgi:SNF2 family DNA or RNA helicase